MKKLLILISLGLTLMFWTGCVSKGELEPTSEQNVTMEQGVVQSVRKIETRNSGVGAMLGGVVGSVAGSVAGSNVGSGTGRVLASVLGSVVGSMAGGKVGNEMNKNYSQEVMVKLNNGQTPKVVLKIDTVTPELTSGQEVNVFLNKGKVFKIISR